MQGIPGQVFKVPEKRHRLLSHSDLPEINGCDKGIVPPAEAEACLAAVRLKVAKRPAARFETPARPNVL